MREQSPYVYEINKHQQLILLHHLLTITGSPVTLTLEYKNLGDVVCERNMITFFTRFKKFNFPTAAIIVKNEEDALALSKEINSRIKLIRNQHIVSVIMKRKIKIMMESAHDEIKDEIENADCSDEALLNSLYESKDKLVKECESLYGGKL